MERELVLAPGARIAARDAEWLVRRVDRTSRERCLAVTVVGISEVVKDKQAMFLTDLESDLEVLDPAETALILDTSPGYQDTMLALESQLRRTIPRDHNLFIGHRAAINVEGYQLDPAIKALGQVRQRILMADSVGLGKTIEVGILLSELIRRGKGKRILVLAVKSMLTQFQKELWARFTIPLVRLDSVGIKRLRERIPTNHNPFYYYDRAIISIDTLKKESVYREWLRECSWDIIVIDEAHHVADRSGGSRIAGPSASQRARLAKLLSSCSDTLILTTATPHDGRARSFASLMNMLDETAIVDPDNYTKNEIKGLYLRRFKKDIQEESGQNFQPRVVKELACSSTAAEERAFELLAGLTFHRLDQRKGAAMLFRYQLEKALFSSPRACLATVKNRLHKLSADPSAEALHDRRQLEQLGAALADISARDFGKYRHLVEVLQKARRRAADAPFAWDPDDPSDRLVLFTERIETLAFLREHLAADLGLSPTAVAYLQGTGMSDTEQQKVVEDFGRKDSVLRILLASDVASEGINLHYFCHKLIHFDVPWSLMIFQQRNGRIDRYGQTRQPYLLYLLTDSANPAIRGDRRVLEILIKKEQQANQNIGDPAAIYALYTPELEEQATAEAMEQGVRSEQDFDRHAKAQGGPDLDDLFAFLDQSMQPENRDRTAALREMPTLFEDDYTFCKTALAQAARRQELHWKADDRSKMISVELSGSLERELRHRFNYLPAEVWPEQGQFVLTADRRRIMQEIERCRTQESHWPQLHLLWEQHPLLEWLLDKVSVGFGRHQAPVVVLPTVRPEEALFLVSGLLPNHKGQPLLHEWHGLRYFDGRFVEALTLNETRERFGLERNTLVNREQALDLAPLLALRADVVQRTLALVRERKKEQENTNKPLLERYINDLIALQERHKHRIESEFQQSAELERIKLAKREDRTRQVDRLFNDFVNWITESLTLSEHPYVRLHAVLAGGSA